jgi:hypothetical protein
LAKRARSRAPDHARRRLRRSAAPTTHAPTANADSPVPGDALDVEALHPPSPSSSAASGLHVRSRWHTLPAAQSFTAAHVVLQPAPSQTYGAHEASVPSDLPKTSRLAHGDGRAHSRLPGDVSMHACSGAQSASDAHVVGHPVSRPLQT